MGLRRDWTVDECATHLLNNGRDSWDGVKLQLETHLAPQRFILRSVLGEDVCKERLKIIRFRQVSEQFQKLFGIVLQHRNRSREFGPKHTLTEDGRRAVEKLYAADMLFKGA